MAGTTPVTDATFAEEIEGHNGLAMVDFWATWCGPCQIIAPHVEALATEYASKVKVAKLDVDQSPQTPARFGVRSIPSVLFFKGGRLVDTVVGAVPKSQLVDRIEKHLG
jgi:thioredoxin 1